MTTPTIRDLELRTDDGLRLEAELAVDEHVATAGTVVLCHPHPQYGGTMRSIVISVLFAQLPSAGYRCLRFNFRGVERSQGAYDNGVGETLDAVAAVRTTADMHPGVPAALAGWSFGGDVALSVTEAVLTGWVAIAPPLRIRPPYAAAQDARPKYLVLAEHDEVREPSDVQEEVASWTATSVAVVPGASHFFVGRTDRVLRETRNGLDRMFAG
jgi:alpha/beta superfamily hydrolase